MNKTLKIFVSALIAFVAIAMVKAQDLPTQHTFICQGDTLRINDSVVISKSGTYTYSLRSVVTGEDSLVRLVVNAYPTYRFEETVHIKQDSSYSWHGQQYNQPGTYKIREKTIYGCDSIYTLTLLVDPKYEVFKDTTVCLGNGFNWNQYYINAQEPGEKDYEATLMSVYGTDSIVHLHVTVWPKIKTEKQLYFCHGGSVTYKDRVYTQQGRDTIVYQSQYGCDSLVILTINEYPTFNVIDTAYIAKGETLPWRGQTITEPKTYFDSYQTINGCDSVYTLVVYEKPSYQFYQDTTICFGEVFEWHNQKVSQKEAGTYEYTAAYSTIWGTDSVYHLTVMVQPKYWTIQQLSICEGTNVSFNGKTYTQSGRDTLYYTSALGCDSVVEVVVTEAYPFYLYDTLQLEAGKTVEWHGQTLSAGGTYTDEHKTISGCDSIYYLYVEMVCVQTWTLKYLTLCQGGTIEYNNKTYTQAGRDTMTFTSSLGCDSVVEVIVSEVYPFHQYDTIQLEAGTTTEWRGQTIAEGGTYTDAYSTVGGCDSIYELYVQLYYVDHIYKDTTICYGESYTWQGDTFNTPGEYVREKRFKNQAGTDSIMHLHLVILPEYKLTKSFTLCQGSTIEYNGKTYNAAGRDTLYFTSGHGCDSIVEVIVTEAYPFYQYDTIRLEAGTTTDWRGQTIVEGGTYTDAYSTVGGCDSIYELYVQLYYVNHIYKDTTICYGETFTWQGETYNEPGEYTREKAFKNVAGTDSILHLHLTILPKYWTVQSLTFCHDKSIIFNGKTYTQPGRDTVYMTSSTGCDSIIEVIISETPTYAFYDTVTIWDTETYEWVGHGQTITGSGEYKDEHISSGGCDSTYFLKVYVQHKDDIYETATICYGETYTWQGNTYGEVGVHHYEVTYANQYGFDSTMHLQLTVLPKYWQQQPLFFCHGSNVSYNGKTYNQESKDTLRFSSVNGCDSIVELIIKEYPTYLYQDTVHLQQGKELNWHGQTITLGGTYTDKQMSIYGCDSTYVLTVILDKVYAFHEKANACVNQTFEWQGLQINEKEAGVYTYSVNHTTIQGSDSTYYLELTVYPTYFEQKQFFICPGGSVNFNNHVYTKAGRDTVYLPSATGCDSLIEVIVSEYPSYHFNQTVHIKKDTPYSWNNETLTQAGSYSLYYSTINGCDSIYTLTLIVDSAYTFHDTAVSCLGDIFEWQGLKINEPAVGQYQYKVNYSTQYGMDSTYNLTLIVRAKSWAQEIVYVCPGENITYHNKTYYKAGRDTILLPAVNGCDSVVEVVVKEYPSYRYNDTVHIKKDSVYTWRGQEYSQTGTYIVPNKSIYGCDSTYTLTLIVDSAYTFYEKAMSCVGETFEWQGLKISEDTAGTYYYTKPYTSIYGMDSVYHLTLTINQSYLQYQYLSFCEGSSVTFGDSTYTTTGTDTLHFQAVGGCDSTIIVVINKQKRFFSSDTITLTNQQTFTWHGQTISQAGTYHDIHTTAGGCDSIYELVAVFNPTYLFEESVTICQCEAPYIWKLNDTTEIALNHEAGQTRMYERRYETIYHTDSIYRIILTINQEYEQTIPLEICDDGSYYEFFGKRYFEPGTYTDTLKTINGCDSIVHIQLNVLPQYIKVDTAYLSQSHPTYTWAINDSTFSVPTVFAINEKTAAGCDSINRLVLLQAPRYVFPIEHDTLCSSGHDAIVWHNQTLTESGIYYDSLFTTLGEDSVYSIELAVFLTYDTTLSVTICEEELPYLFNNRIKCTETGTYLDTIQTIHGCDSVVRLELNVLPRVIEQVFDTICETDLANGYFFHGEAFYNEGTYSRPLQEDAQCNSSIELFLRLRPDLSENDSVVICAGETYVLGRAYDPEINEQYRGITVQPMKDTIIWGCDNIHYFRIIVRNEKDTTVNMCENDSLWLPGTKRWVYPVPNAVYMDTIKTDPLMYSLNPDSVHCDSIVRWTIGSIYPTYHPDTIMKHISDHDSILWAGQWRTATGIYVDSAKTVECGCDSILILKLIVDKTYSFRDSIHICQPHDVAYQHEWPDGHIQSQSIWNEGVYVDSLRSTATADLYQYYPRDYKDSIYTLVVTMDPSYFFQQEYTLCQGDSVQLAGQWITKAGVYTDSLMTAKGCDSIYQYVVNMTQSYYYRENKSIAQGTTYTWHGKHLNATGVYFDSLQTTVGCDSIYELTLTVYPIYHFRHDTTICACQTPYIWHDQMLYQTGIYYDSLQTIHHFDSIYELRLQVMDTTHVRVNASSCKGDSIFFDGRWLTQSGVYYDTVKNVFGCDSIIELVYIHKNSYLFEQTAQTDDQHPYIWSGHKDKEGNDMTFTASGLYQDKHKSIDGCDSIYQLTLTVYPTYRDTLKQHICNNDSLLWRGKYYYTTGIYTDALKTVAGYDSIFVLDLTVLPISEVRVNASTCEGDSVFFDGRWITQEGTYYDTLVNVLGCDSIVEFVYTHKNSYLFEQTAQTDDQHPYIWSGHKDKEGNDMTFTASGLYQDKHKSIDGCDSIYQLTLTVYPTYRDTLKQTICGNDRFYWRGNYYNESGCYTDALKTVAGYDSLIVLELTVLPIRYGHREIELCQDDSVIINNHVIYANNQLLKEGGDNLFYDTLACDSVVITHLTILPKYFFTESRIISEDSLPLAWHGQSLEMAGTYYDYAKTVGGCDSTYELHLTVSKLADYTFAICQSELPYKLPSGKQINAAGIYPDTIRDAYGRDSLINKYRVIVNPTLRGEVSVSICEGDSFPWNGQQLTVGGNYVDTLSSPVTGCDSIVTLHLFVKKSYFLQRTQTIYAGDSVFFEGDTLKYPGLYEKRYQTTDTAHCDSIIQLNLKVKPIYYRDTTAYICESELPFHWNWHNESFYSEGTYIRTSITEESKFVDTLHLYVDKQHLITIQSHICEGDTLYYRDKIYTASGTFYDTIPAASGCDTIYKVVVGVYPNSTQKLIVHISENEKYIFGQMVVDTVWTDDTHTTWSRIDTIHEARELYKTGTYYDYNKNIFGCDSITILTLYVHPKIVINLKEQICKSELPYIFNGKKLYEAGEYRDSMYTKEGYDSIVVLNLAVMPTYLIEESYTIKAGTHTFIHDLDISAPGIYYDSLKTINGCDSVYKIIVNYPRTWKQEYDVEICQGETFNFFGMEYKQGGTYRYTSPNEDTLIIAHLTVLERKFTKLSHVLCSDGDSLYYYLGRELKAPIIVRDTFKTVEGCDSIVIFDLQITEKCSDWYQAPLCKGDSLIILADTIRQPGDYELLRKSQSGKNDSIYRVSFYEAPNFEVSVVDTICQGDTVWVGPNPITRSGLQNIVLKTTEGCDSIIHLDLTVNPSYSFVNKVVTVDYQPYTWTRDGRTYNKTGKYDYVLPTINNCDSTFILDLEVIETQRPVQKEEICVGSTITWRGKDYSETGIYTDTVCNIASRTSIIYSLDLTVILPTNIDTAIIRTQEVCADAQELIVDLRWSGATPQRYNVYFDARAHHEGFQDIQDAPFVEQDKSISIPLPELGVLAYANHMRYIRPDKYSMTLVLDNGICGLSKSKPVSFLVRYPNWILEQNWDNVVAVLASDYNGGFEFSQYEWRINGAFMPDKLPYLRNDNLLPGDSVTAYLTRSGEDYSIPTCPLIITEPNPDVYPDPVLNVEPTSAPVTSPRFVIRSQNDGHYSIYSIMGQTVGQGNFRKGESTVTLPAIIGHYIIYATQDDGTTKAQKVLVY